MPEFAAQGCLLGTGPSTRFIVALMGGPSDTGTPMGLPPGAKRYTCAPAPGGTTEVCASSSVATLGVSLVL